MKNFRKIALCLLTALLLSSSCATRNYEDGEAEEARFGEQSVEVLKGVGSVLVVVVAFVAFAVLSHDGHGHHNDHHCH